MACIDTATEPVAIDLWLAGTAVEGPIEARGGVPVTLERAALAFGPLTLCAGVQAGDNCDAALVEWTDAAVVNALESRAVEVGALVGVSGEARSYMYDFGFVSLLTSIEPLPLAATEALDGASVVLEGSAGVGTQTIPFRASLRLMQPADVERGSPLVRSGADDALSLPLTPSAASITLRIDAAPWVRDIDFVALVENRECAAGVGRVCAGAVERQCAPDGSMESERDCRDSGEVCLRGIGCTAQLDITAGSQAAAAIRTALLAGPRPSITLE